jgi:16S rRNA (guanine527-N7)-methyltransferase
VKVPFHVKHRNDPAALASAARVLGVTLSSSQLASLALFETLLLEHAVHGGMVAESDAGRIRARHLLDSLRAAAAVSGSDRDAYDLGSGAGLPGIVVAIARPALSVALVETRARRVAFLELAVERLALDNASVLRSRIEDLRDTVDLCFARALAPLPHAWALAEPLLRPSGRLVYFAGEGASVPDEIAGASTRILSTSVLERGGPLVIMAR